MNVKLLKSSSGQSIIGMRALSLTTDSWWRSMLLAFDVVLGGEPEMSS